MLKKSSKQHYGFNPFRTPVINSLITVQTKLTRLPFVWVNAVSFLLAVPKLNVDRYPNHNTIPTVSNDSFRNTKKRVCTDWRLSVKRSRVSTSVIKMFALFVQGLIYSNRQIGRKPHSTHTVMFSSKRIWGGVSVLNSAIHANALLQFSLQVKMFICTCTADFQIQPAITRDVILQYFSYSIELTSQPAWQAQKGEGEPSIFLVPELLAIISHLKNVSSRNVKRNKEAKKDSLPQVTEVLFLAFDVRRETPSVAGRHFSSLRLDRNR